MNWIFMVIWMLVGALSARPAAALVRRLDKSGSSPPADRGQAAAWSAAIFAVLAARLPVGPALAAYSALAALLVPLVVIDLRDQRLPTKPMIVAAATTTIMFIAFAAVDHEPGPLLRALVSSGTCLLLLVITYLITPGFIGGGDIRLAALLVLALGWTSWSAAARGVMIGLLIGATYSLYLRLRQRLGPHGHIPLGPTLALGALSSILID